MTITAYTSIVKCVLLVGLAWVLLSVVVGPPLGRWIRREARERELGLRCVHGYWVGECSTCR